MGIRIIDERAFEKLKQLVKDVREKSRQLIPVSSKSEWLDNQQVCMLLDISPRTLQSHRDRGILAYSQTGHKCYYKKSDVEKLMQKSRVDAKPIKK
ncbi:helix-turn-helix domain-containing protein [Dysgonomonas sp. ZJ709]|uniref:helix-turn-helix domain-containing protein n=1 Tax=Dysgonomonas sp. ZJ709 TaxID=2709797 RepID=UPI0013EB793E|nr:helix-turn-helix domain-containing protein [Dysgonomonas sp. ZJ709]